MRVTTLQPNYIPWRGYFDFFKQSDMFILYDDVQYTRRDWRNRNSIKTPDGPQWITIPVEDKGRNSLINEAKIIWNGWPSRQLQTIERFYKNAPYVGVVLHMLEEAFDEGHDTICDLDESLIMKVLDYLGIRCKTVRSSKVGFSDLKKTDRLVAMCQEVGATEYYSGESAKDYLEVEKFGDIRVLWHRYNENVYPQLWGDFVSAVSIIDLIANCGLKGYDII